MLASFQTATAVQSLAHTSLDILVLGALIGALFVFGVMRGRQVLVRSAIALYPAMLITAHFPYEYVSGMAGMAYLKLIVCAVTTVAVFYMLGNEQYRYYGGGMRHWISTGVLSVVTGGLGCLALYRVVDFGTVYTFSPLFDALFLPPHAFVLWLVVPLIAIPLIHRT